MAASRARYMPKVYQRQTATRKSAVRRACAQGYSSLGWLLGARERQDEPIKGLPDRFGEVGRGKTMRMRLFSKRVQWCEGGVLNFQNHWQTGNEPNERAFREKLKLGEVRATGPIRLTAGASPRKHGAARLSTNFT